MNQILITGYVTNVFNRAKDDPFYLTMMLRSAEEQPAVNIRPGDSLSICGYMSPELVQPGSLLRVTSTRTDGSMLTYLKAQIEPTDEENLIRYLSTGAVARLTRSTATKIVKHFGCRTLELLDSHPEAIREVLGINTAAQNRVTTLWALDRQKASAVIEAMSIGLSLVTARRAVEHFGENAADQLLSNPYLLSYVHGYGFRKADQFAQLRGMKQDSDERIKAASWYCLTEAIYEGHVYLPVEELNNRVVKETKIPLERIKSVSLPEEILVTPSRKAYTQQLYEAERYVSRHIRTMSYDRAFKLLSYEKIIQALAAYGGLSKDQYEALVNVLAGPKLSVIMGLPGTGKTTLIKTLISVLNHNGMKTVLAAPTGKAAARITEQTGQQAMTLHRVLGYTLNGTARRNESNPIITDCLIVDEASMIDIVLMQQLLVALSADTVLILVGDPEQLPPVGPGNIFREIKDKRLCNIVTLTEIHRQSSSSQIIQLAHSIHDGRFPCEIFGYGKECQFVSEEDVHKIRNKVIDLVMNNNRYPPHQIQVLAPMRKGVIGTIQINTELQGRMRRYNINMLRATGINVILNKDAVSYHSIDIGDRVIQTTNNYRKCVFNGEIGYVVRRTISEYSSGDCIFVLFDDGREVFYESHELTQLDLAYALTVHRGQGSEYPCVVIPISTTNYIMLFRSLLYTAVTRARESLIMVGSMKASCIAVNNNKPDGRYINLSEINI